jgi:Tol biopolymer transport system component
LLFSFSGCARKTNVQVVPSATIPKEKRLATIPADYDKWSDINFSTDGKKVIYKASRKGGHFIVVNNTEGRAYEGINDRPVFSPDGMRVAYDGTRGGKEHLVVDDREVKSYDDIVPSLFSPDGRLVASEAEEKDKWFITVSDGEKELYRGQGSYTCRKPILSTDGTLIVYELIEEKKITVYILDPADGKIMRERPYAESETGDYSFSSDSLKMLYNIIKEGRHYLVLYDFTSHTEREIEVPYETASGFTLSPDGKMIIYNINKKGKYYFVESPWESPELSRESGPYGGYSSVTFSLDSATASYLAMIDGKWHSVVGDRKGPKYDDVVRDAQVFSPDSSMIAYPAMKNGKWVMVISSVDSPAKAYEGPAYDRVFIPAFSPDSTHVVYGVGLGTTNKARRLVIANTKGKVIKKGPIFDEVWPPVWSSDSKTVSYGARNGRELWWKVESLP